MTQEMEDALRDYDATQYSEWLDLNLDRLYQEYIEDLTIKKDFSIFCREAFELEQ